MKKLSSLHSNIHKQSLNVAALNAKNKSNTTGKTDCNYYKLIETKNDGDCGVDACQKLLQQANIILNSSTLELRGKICEIVASIIEFHQNFNNINDIKYSIIEAHLKKAFRTLNIFASLGAKKLEKIINNQQESLKECKKEEGKNEILQGIETKREFITKLKKLKEWEGLQEVCNLDKKLFITLVKDLLHIDINHVFTSHGVTVNKKNKHINLKDYYTKVASSKSWFTNSELMCFLRYYGLYFERYKNASEIQATLKGTILEFSTHEGKILYLHSDATMQGFQENSTGTHWQPLKKVKVEEDSEKTSPTVSPNKNFNTTYFQLDAKDSIDSKGKDYKANHHEDEADSGNISRKNSYFADATITDVITENDIKEGDSYTIFPRCEFYHRFNNTSIFPNDIDRAHVYTRSEGARYAKGNKSIVKFIPYPLTKPAELLATKKNSLAAHTGGFANPYRLANYSKNIKLTKYKFSNKHPVEPKLYDELLKYKLGLCQYIASEFKQQLENTNLGGGGNDQGVYCSNNYPSVLVRFTPKIYDKNVTTQAGKKTFYKRYNHLLMAYFIAIVDYNAYEAGIEIEMLGRSSFGHNNPSIAVADKSFRINIGLVPKDYADIIVTSLVQLYQLFNLLENTDPAKHLIMNKALQARLNKGRESGFKELKLPDTYWAALWAKGSHGSNGRIMLHELIERERDRPELLANFVLESIIANPKSFFTNPLLAESPLEKMFELVSYQPNPNSTKKKSLAHSISVNSKDRLKNHPGFVANTIKSRKINTDPAFLLIIQKLCNGLAIDLPSDLEISSLYKFLEIAHIKFICEKRTRTLESLDKISDWGSDSDTEEPNFVKTKSIFSKKVIVANGMLAINLAYYAARAAISFVEAVTQRESDDIDAVFDEYDYKMEFRKISVNCENTYFETEGCLQNAVNPPSICKGKPADILFFDLNSFSDDFISRKVDLEAQLKVTKPKIVVLDHTSSATGKIALTLRKTFHRHSNVLMVLLVTSGLKNEQGGADNNPFGKVTIFSLGAEWETNTLTNFIYQEITALTSSSAKIKLNANALLSKAAHAIRHSYKDRGFTTTSRAILHKSITDGASNITVSYGKLNSVLDEVTYILTLRDIKDNYECEFDNLVKVGLSENKIFDLYEQSIEKFETMAQDDVITLLSAESDDLSFDELSEIYDKEPDLFKAILNDEENLIQDFGFNEFCNAYRSEQDEEYPSEDDCYDTEESIYETLYYRLATDRDC